MKKFLLSGFLFLIGIGMAWLTADAATNSISGTSLTLHFIKVKAGEEPETNPNIDPHGKRTNRCPLTGTISPSGIYIPGVDNNDIISFEIYTSNGICIGIYSEEIDFIKTLFSLSGEYEIRIVTDYAVFAGIIEI
ncbi:MAG: hypothetical protein K2H96_09810 [Muribaculaceae bacterium]|nr:hypothetical protein [Muribaculaceae bacterium]